MIRTITNTGQDGMHFKGDGGSGGVLGLHCIKTIPKAVLCGGGGGGGGTTTTITTILRSG